MPAMPDVGLMTEMLEIVRLVCENTTITVNLDAPAFLNNVLMLFVGANIGYYFSRWCIKKGIDR